MFERRVNLLEFGIHVGAARFVPLGLLGHGFISLGEHGAKRLDRAVGQDLARRVAEMPHDRSQRILR